MHATSGILIFYALNPLPTSDTCVASWSLRKPIGIYMGDYLILGVILQYMFLLLLAVAYDW